MATRHRNAVNALKRFKASRPEVLAVLVSVDVMGWGWLIQFRGSRDALLAAGVAEEQLFALPLSGKQARRDEFGDLRKIRRRSDGRFDIERHCGSEPYELGNCGRGRSWKTLGAGVVAEVDGALERMRRPRKAVLP